MIERQPHGRQRRHGNDDSLLHALRVQDGPLQGLHAPKRAAHDQPELPNPQRIQQLGLCPDVVADGNQREVRTIDAACFRIDRTGARRAITGTQYVDTDHEIAIQRQNPAGAEDLRPPGAHQSRAGERVTNQHGIVARGIQSAIHRIMQRGAGQRAATVQQQWLVEHKVAFVGGRQKWRFGRRGSGPGLGFSHSTHCAAWPAVVVAPAKDWPLATSIAWSRSARISRISSMPTLSRTSSGVTPAAACSSTESC